MKNLKTGGRTKGTPNKISKSVKDMLLGALDDVGGQEYFKTLALENPTAFASLIKHITPQEVAKKDDEPVRHSPIIMTRSVK